MRPTSPIAALAASTLAAVLLTGCSEAEDAAKDAAGNAACAVATKAVSGVTGQVDDAIDQIGADPAAAKRKLSGLRDVVARAEDGLSGDAKQRLGEARQALDDLVGEASDAASGLDVDTSAVDSSRKKLSRAVDDVADVC